MSTTGDQSDPNLLSRTTAEPAADPQAGGADQTSHAPGRGELARKTVGRDPATAPPRSAPGWRPSSGVRHGPRLFIALAIALGLTVLVLFQFAKFAKKGSINLGQGKLAIRGATEFGKRRDADGPILLSDPTGRRKKDIWIVHIPAGDRWAVFAGSVNGDRRCTLGWRPGTQDFIDPCTKLTFPLTGVGVEQYQWEVTKSNVLVIDVNKPSASP